MYNDDGIRRAADSQSSDYKWYKENYTSLYEKYGECYLAIKNKTVLGTYKTFAEGVKETEKIEPPGTYIIQQCTKNIEDTYVYIYTPFFDI